MTLGRSKGLEQGCGQKWFATEGLAEGRAGKIAFLNLAGSVPVQAVPCPHGRGGYHLEDVPVVGTAVPAAGTPSRPARLPGGFTPKVRWNVRTRAGGGDPHEAVCEACGRPLGVDGGQFQHRYARGMGGCRLAVINGPSNACLVCGTAFPRTGCHGLAEDRNPLMQAFGIWLKPGQDPRTTPIRLYGRGGGLREVWLPASGAPRYLDKKPILDVAA